MKICPTCQTQFPDGYTFCLKDGAQLSQSVAQVMPLASVTQSLSFCGNCAAPMSGEYAFCKSCGASRHNFAEQKAAADADENVESDTSARRRLGDNKPFAIAAACVVAIPIFIGLLFYLSSGSENTETKSAVVAPFNSNRVSNVSNQNYAPTNATYSIRDNTNAAANQNSSQPEKGRTGRLTTDLNLRDEPNRYAASLGIQFRGAKIKVLDSTTFETPEGEMSTWYKVRVFEYGCSSDANLGCGKNLPGDADEGWLNGKYVLLD